MNVAFEVGKTFLPALGMGEGIRFGLDSCGATLMYMFDSPTRQEIRATKSGKRFEIRFITIDGIIWILSKCGNMNWTDAPYNPRLLGSAVSPISIADGEGLALLLMMLDADNAVVKSLRYIGLGTEFSRHLLAEALKVQGQPMSKMDATESIKRTMLAYTTDNIAEMAKERFVIPGTV